MEVLETERKSSTDPVEDKNFEKWETEETQMIVSNLDERTTLRRIRKSFSKYGKVADNQNTGKK